MGTEPRYRVSREVISMKWMTTIYDYFVQEKGTGCVVQLQRILWFENVPGFSLDPSMGLIFLLNLSTPTS